MDVEVNMEKCSSLTGSSDTKSVLFGEIPACFTKNRMLPNLINRNGPVDNENSSEIENTNKRNADDNPAIIYIENDDSLKDICPQSPLRSSFNSVLKSLPTINLMNDSDSSALIHQRWDSTDSGFECSFFVDSSTTAQRGITYSAKKINLREDQNKNCLDYVTIHLENGFVQPFCVQFDGRDEFSQKYGYGYTPLSVLKVVIFVSKQQLSSGPLEIELAFTAYEACTETKRNQIQCSDADPNFCISDKLKSDGTHNCMAPSSADEPNQPFPNSMPSTSPAPQRTGVRPSIIDAPQPTNDNHHIQKDNHHHHHHHHAKTGPNGVAQAHVNYGMFYLITIITSILALTSHQFRNLREQF